MAGPLWGDGSLWGEDLYYSASAAKSAYVAYQETNGTRIALVIKHDANQVAGLGDTFALHSLRAMLAPIHQVEYTHEAYIDLVTPSERIALQVNLTSPEDGALYTLRLKGSRKRYKKG